MLVCERILKILYRLWQARGKQFIHCQEIEMFYFYFFFIVVSYSLVSLYFTQKCRLKNKL